MYRNATALVKGPGNDRAVRLSTAYSGGKSSVYILAGVLLPDSLLELRGNEVFSDEGQTNNADGATLRTANAKTLVMTAVPLMGLALALLAV
jgi:hypothetical protein